MIFSVLAATCLGVICKCFIAGFILGDYLVHVGVLLAVNVLTLVRT